MTEERVEREESDERAVREMIGDRLDERIQTRVEQSTVQLSLRGVPHLRGTPIMERDYREKDERGESGERGGRGESSERDDRRQIRGEN